MDKNHQIIEPDFEGEVMKLPTTAINHLETSNTNTSRTAIPLPIIILFGLFLVGILGGFYYWYTIVMKEGTSAPIETRPTAAENNEPESTTAEVRTELLDIVSTSNELSAIKADAESTHLDDLTTEIPAIETELNAALKTTP